MKKPANKGRQAKILIVDDHPIVREYLGGLIRQQPDLTVCGEAGDLRSGMEAVTRFRPDLVIVDISLKGAYGTDLIRDVKESFPKLPVLVLSMHEELLFAERALRAGARGYITKQEATHNILAAIRQVLDGKVYLSEKMGSVLLTKIVEGKPGVVSSPIEMLSDRELQVFHRIGQGISPRQIADEMHLSIKTIESHCSRIKDKLSLKDASELLQFAIQWRRTELNQ
jgi:DNA-binding NarL/FixJ family response regulator